ncbi:MULTISPECIES: hypothetical protein [Sorangium]|uniref:VWA7 N-terminal domain-containing protein n=1 Tax=Sorangium cellulosum TaxID=56 RepID=A0A4V0NFZ0_SORCE|nr:MULTISPECIES: hypothetical protein [Sorangium]AUX31342.1 hypothetical protein SOCE836_034710 [Sorangium cellulosum]WCQ90725.1 hypothetical protein NQZ70_03436 [Sorangium sp. Soce836]
MGLTLTLGCVGEAETAEALDESADAFSTAPGEPNHEEITHTALSFLKPSVLTALKVGNVSTDVAYHFSNTAHFDDCNFSGGAAFVAAKQAEAVRALGPGLPLLDGDALAMLAFGRSLHAVQDFYAHTNWVELGGDVLVDQSLTAFPALAPYSAIPSTGFIVVQGDKPKRAAVTRDADAPYPEYAIVTVRVQRTNKYGLVSGTVEYEPGNYCPPPVAMTHDELSKDKTSLTDRTAQHLAAKSLAIQQTRHEWCRLNRLARDAWGDAGTARLAAWVADPSSAPDCGIE